MAAANPRGNVNTGLIQEINQDLKELGKKYVQLAAEWSILKNRLQVSETHAAETSHKIDRILSILENDNTTGSTGIVHQVRENSKFRQEQKTTIKLIGIVAGIIGGLLVAFLKDIIFKS